MRTIAVGALILGAFLAFIFFGRNGGVTEKTSFALLDPEIAPAEIKPLVMEGYHIILNTPKHAPEYAGDKLSCTNCHFSGGNTLGGKRGGLPLVGVVKLFPKHLEGGKLYTLEDRVNDCFKKSLNGKPLPKTSREMQAIVAYLN